MALVFGLPRKEAQAKIEHGLVFLNNVPCLKPERQVAEGDRLTVRGVGRRVWRHSVEPVEKAGFLYNMLKIFREDGCCQVNMTMIYLK